MLGCHDTITLWRKKKNPETKKDEFERLVLAVKCKWRTQVIRNVAESGEIIKRNVTVVIPYENNYIFDGKIGDYLALGEQNIEIIGEKPFRADDVRELLSPNFFKIDFIKNNIYLSMGKCFRAEGIL